MGLHVLLQSEEDAEVFADRCQEPTRLAPLDFDALTATLDTSPEEGAKATGRHVLSEQWLSE
ncbi:hypothetical protein JOF41_005968 [Saccharothrix coeruleofusca]|uniref:hypothetical protein n=1 Tax=Saccharothrix coeruleofusca TaxID=33919 RepID=UPI001AE92A52|nr:hypothetical protein [Saccharothrix coeruleofusca]MBP2339790.1 hypothetical protein [Saccharothrix coeruleofusca]